MTKPKIILIVGPTGTGKTEYSVALAKRLCTEIISCDSMQIYRHMDIGTAKIKEDEMQGIVHHMISIAEPTQNYSVCDYVNESKKIIDDMIWRGKIPLVVGGTGLYADSLTNGIDFFESAPSDSEYRDKLNREAQEYGVEYIYEKLKKVDEKSSMTIHPNNVKRVIRALEYYHVTGETISSHNEKTKDTEPPYECCKIGFIRDRESMYERIDKRVDNMIDSGLIDEVKNLIDRGCTYDNTSMQAIGYKEVVDYIRGNVSYMEMIKILKQNSRRYAKRQVTWFKRDNDINWINLDRIEGKEEVTSECLKIIQKTFCLKGV